MDLTWLGDNYYLQIRETILTQLRPRDRQMLRLVCRQLSNEIDQFIGPVNCINVSDGHAKKYLTFFSKCYIPCITIAGLSTSLTLTSVVMNPARLKSFTVAPKGIASTEFVYNTMKNGSSLTNLNISGKLKGLITPINPIHLPKLKSFTLNSNNFHLHITFLWETHINAFVNVLNGRGFDHDMVMAFWHNQIAILRMVQAPKLEEATLFLHTLANVMWEQTSETELMAEVLAFMGRHRGLKSIKLYHGERLIESRLFEYHTPLSIFNKSYRRNSPQLTRPDTAIHPNDLSSGNIAQCFASIKQFEYCSRLPTHFEDESNPASSFENHVLNLLKSLRGLTQIKFSATKGRPISWTHFEQIISSNSESLVHFEIVGKLQGPINFGVLSHCESLKVIMINNKQRYRHASLSPVIEHFSVTMSMVDMLETLILQNIGLKGGDFKSLFRLRKLKHLGIYRWRCGLGEENLTQEGVKSVLA